MMPESARLNAAGRSKPDLKRRREELDQQAVIAIAARTRYYQHLRLCLPILSTAGHQGIRARRSSSHNDGESRAYYRILSAG